MWFYNYALTYYDDCANKSVRKCGITIGTDMRDVVDRLYRMYGDFWDCHIDFCGEDNEDVLTEDGIAAFMNWREKYVDYTKA